MQAIAREFAGDTRSPPRCYNGMTCPAAPSRPVHFGSVGLLVTLLFVGVPACADAPVLPAAASTPAPAEEPASSPLAALERPARTEYEATVLDCLPAGGYSYLELALADGERRWAVIASERPAVGAAVRARVHGTRTHFDSRRLKRSFDRLDFATIETI